MKLGTRGRYAVMAIVDLALHSKGGQPVALSSIAERQEISLSYLEQIFNKLKHHGLVKSVRGAAGGYVLAYDPFEMSVGEIVAAVGEPMHTTRCAPKSGQGCLTKGAKCIVHEVWADLDHHIDAYLRSKTLGDICKNYEEKRGQNTQSRMLYAQREVQSGL